MIYIILQENEETMVSFGTKIQERLGKANVRVVASCAEFELQWIFDNYSEHEQLTVIGIHPKYEERKAVNWAKKYEEAFNVPVFVGKVWTTWR